MQLITPNTFCPASSRDGQCEPQPARRVGRAEGRSHKKAVNFSKFCLLWAPRPLANHLNKVEQGQDKPKTAKRSNKSPLFPCSHLEDGIRKEGLEVVPGRQSVKNGANGSRKASPKVSCKARPWNLQHLPFRKVKGFPWPEALLWQPWRC